MRDVEVRLSEPWSAPGIRLAKRNRPGGGILGHIDPLVAAIYSHGFGDLLTKHETNVHVRILRAALVGGLEKTELLAERCQVTGVAVNGLVHTLARINDGIGFTPERVV